MTNALRGGDLLQPLMAGLLAAMVGYASTFALVLAGYTHVGASADQAGAGLFALTVATGLLNLIIAWRTRLPLTIAWSAPGAAFLLTVAPPAGGYSAAAGAFLVAAMLILLAGLWRRFGRAVAAIPAPIANAMLAGILLNLCLAPLRALQDLPWLTLPIILVWVVGLRLARRYAVPLAVLATIIVLATTLHLPEGTLDRSWPLLMPILPTFELDAIVRISLPLFIVTMASQNLPGLAVMRANGYQVDPAPAFVATGLTSAIIAFFGAHTANLAAIVAAICAGPEAHPDPKKRWVATASMGLGNLLLAPFAGLAAAFVAVSPPILIQAVAGLALMTSLAAALSGALTDESKRLPAIVTFVTTASGVTFFGIGAAFWGLVAGLVLAAVLGFASRKTN